MELSTMSPMEASTVKSEMSSSITEHDTDTSSWWVFAAMITVFILVSLFCFVIFVVTITASDVQETTPFDEDLELSGGDKGDKPSETTTEKPIGRVTTARLPKKKPEATRSMRPTVKVASTRSSSRATMTTAVPVALAAPLGTVVCTVSIMMPPETYALPPDGACDLLFFESFYKDNKNILANGYTSLRRNARMFVEHASSVTKTQYGASLALTKTLSKADLMTKKFYEGIDDLWNRKIYHFGFLNLYREFAAPEAVTDALLVLKELYFHVKLINQQRQPSYQVLGLSIDFAVNHTTVQLMSSLFVPSMFISIGHISYSDASFSSCRILPPTIRFFPSDDDSLQYRTYGHELAESAELLQIVGNRHRDMSLALSVGLSGRYYSPRNHSYQALSKPFMPFEKCTDFSGPRYDDPANLCQGQLPKSNWVVDKNDYLMYIALYEPSKLRTFTYDNTELIKKKVCDTKGRSRRVLYSLAAYDVDFDSSTEGCTEFGINDGAFDRLSIIRPLSDYVLGNYISYFQCLRVNSTEIQALHVIA